MAELPSKFHLFDPHSLAEQKSDSTEQKPILDSVDGIWRKLAAYTEINDFEQSKSEGKKRMDKWVLNKVFNKNHLRFTYVFFEKDDWDEVKKQTSLKDKMCAALKYGLYWGKASDFQVIKTHFKKPQTPFEIYLAKQNSNDKIFVVLQMKVGQFYEAMEFAILAAIKATKLNTKKMNLNAGSDNLIKKGSFSESDWPLVTIHILAAALESEETWYSLEFLPKEDVSSQK